MATITIYRLEHNERRVGPYRDLGFEAKAVRGLPGYSPEALPLLREQLSEAHTHPSKHPHPWYTGEPWEEFGDASCTPYTVMCEKFGFLYLDDLKRWFGNWISILAYHGYVIKEYQVDESRVRLGNRQVSFDEETL